MTRPDTKGESKQSRRDFLLRAGATATGLVFAPALLPGRLGAAGPLPAAVGPLPAAAGARQAVMRIGIIGSGNIGGAVGLKWAEAGHEILFSSRHPEELTELVERAGSRTRAGLPAEAAAFGEVVLIAVPYAALPQVGRDYAGELRGKVVLDTCNPFPGRDGEMAVAARAKGTGVASPEFLPGVRLVRAFNSVSYLALRSEAHRAGERVAIPLAGDDAAALGVARRLVGDAGFEPVVVGGLDRAIEFDPGTTVFGQALTARELRRLLKISP